MSQALRVYHVRMFHHNNRGKIDLKSRKIMIFAKIKKKILVWCDDPPEDRVISIVAGCLANHDRAHSPSVTWIEWFCLNFFFLK